ncbi:hypothetical protein SELMODRAFT_410051 [Selaginella moellendorffii]|uniref:Uncharacterized protein n=1 Tax=Selaginella moellendorffii TaxID=88036 RepID=D8RDB5_SELML|nr:hypothetical protein SELMODRAFT_410051 [Selaginella moellendorffii]
MNCQDVLLAGELCNDHAFDVSGCWTTGLFDDQSLAPLPASDQDQLGDGEVLYDFGVGTEQGCAADLLPGALEFLQTQQPQPYVVQPLQWRSNYVDDLQYTYTMVEQDGINPYAMTQQGSPNPCAPQPRCPAAMVGKAKNLGHAKVASTSNAAVSAPARKRGRPSGVAGSGFKPVHRNPPSEAEKEDYSTYAHYNIGMGACHAGCHVIVTWDFVLFALDSAMGTHLPKVQAKDIFSHMPRHHATVQLLDRIKLDELKFVCLLSSVAYTGTVDEVQEWFMAMVADNFVEPTLQQYCCLIAALARPGRLRDAEDLIVDDTLASLKEPTFFERR